jgi:predicted HAD superfamily Cof-like phosphohydrolase
MIREIFLFNDQVIGIGPQPLNPLTQKQAEWLLKFIDEEATEFREAFESQDIVKMVDAVIDLCYGAMGTLRKMGLDESQAMASFMAVHIANMSKEKGNVARRGDSTEDAVKPEGFVPPDVRIAEILGLTNQI